MKTNFFDHINIDQKNTYLPDGMAKDLDAECRRYDAIIRSLGGIDMQLLGIGHNGHVGFNEPGELFMKDTFCVKLSMDTINANARYFPSPETMPKSALTVGIRTIMQARRIVVAVSGIAKAPVLYKVLSGQITPQVPASILQLHANVTLVADREAVSVTMENDPELITKAQ
jgi:glucosamine-6-phosphate deaminase